MPTGIPPKKIVFPPVNQEQEARLKKLFESMAEFMDTELKFATETIITVSVPEDRVDVAAVINKILTAMKKH